jgi:hypothetical protein
MGINKGHSAHTYVSVKGSKLVGEEENFALVTSLSTEQVPKSKDQLKRTLMKTREQSL